MSRLPKFNGSKIPPPTASVARPAVVQEKEAVFKAPQAKLVNGKSTTHLSKAAQAANVPKMAAALKHSMSRRSKSVAEFRRPLLVVKDNPIVRPTATVSASDHSTNKRPVKRPGAPLHVAGRPKLAKQSPPKAKPKITAKPAPYDYKARFGLLKETHDVLKTNHASLKEKFNELSDENEVLSTTNEQLKTDLDAAQCELIQLRAAHERLSIDNAEFRACLAQAESELDETKVKLHRVEEEHANCDRRYSELSVQFTESVTALEATRADLEGNQDLVSALKQQVYTLDFDKRRMHNDMQDLKGNIRVFCRVRPSLPEERNKLLCNINFADENSIELSKGKESLEPTGRPRMSRADFIFDKVFTTGSSQESVFEELAQLVQSALDGYNVCVFAYGQTGSGKTYTMEGGTDTVTTGMIPRAIDLIFQSFPPLERIGWTYTVKASFLEIYNENIVDLLDPSTTGHHEIRMTDARGTDVYVTNLTVERIESAEQLKEFMKIAQQNRAVAATENNERSSRSHSVSKILLEAVNEERNERCTGSLNLIDLAGSERVQTASNNPRITETKNINKSLANLGNVILALVQKQDHIPYRNSKLTHLLMPSLGGNSKTLMLVNIAPFEECYGESVNSLRFASTVNQCRTGTVRKNKTVHSSTSFS